MENKKTIPASEILTDEEMCAYCNSEGITTPLEWDATSELWYCPRCSPQNSGIAKRDDA